MLAGVANLIAVRIESGRIEEADALLPRALELAGTQTGDDYAYLMAARATIRKRRKRHAESASDLTSAISILESAEIDVRREMARSLAELGWVLRRQGRKHESIAVQNRLKAMLEGGRTRVADINPAPAFRVSHVAFRPD